VERVLSHKGTGVGLRYLVLWKGYGFEEATWEPASALAGAQEAVADYKRTQAQLPQWKKNTRRGKRKMPTTQGDSSGNAAAPQTDSDRPELAAATTVTRTSTVQEKEDSSHKMYNHTPKREQVV
jgi:hypothetical protein